MTREEFETLKVGDLVMAINNASGQFTIGKIYTVSGLCAGTNTKLDDSGSTTNGWSYGNFALTTIFEKASK